MMAVKHSWSYTTKGVKEINFFSKHTDILTEKINNWYKENPNVEVINKICKLKPDNNNLPMFWVNISYRKIENLEGN